MSLYEGVYQATVAEDGGPSLRSLAHWQPSNVIQCCCKSRSATMLDEEADADLDNEPSFERPQEFPTVPLEELALTFCHFRITL